MRDASWSASSRYCVVSSTVVPSSTRSRIMSHSALRLVMSSPVVGSSRNRIGGRWTSEAAMSRRRRMPPEYVRTGRSAASVSSKAPSSSAARGAISLFCIWLEDAHHLEVLAPGEVGIDGGVLPGEPDPATHGVGLLHHVVAQDLGSALVGIEHRGQHPHHGRLARAVGSEQSEHRAGFDLEVDPVEGDHLVVPLLDAFHHDRVVRHACDSGTGPCEVSSILVSERLGDLKYRDGRFTMAV